MNNPIDGVTIDDSSLLTVSELCRIVGIHAEFISELVAEGVLDANGTHIQDWRFSGNELRRVQIAIRLQRDLNVNTPGIALALDLLDRIEALKQQAP